MIGSSPTEGSPPTAALIVVLASYRGGAHIRAQISSLQAQTFEDWTLLVRDDGSDDETPQILREMSEQDPRIRVITDQDGRLGVIGNFSRLLQHALEAGTEWIALCDQDDVWFPDKLKTQLEKALAARVAPTEPFLLHSDVAVTDAQLAPKSPSLMQLMGLRHEVDTPLATLLVQNFVTGCSCLLNRALLEAALPIPKAAVMSDWWLALCAGATGRIEFEPRPLLHYRQHDHNAVGAKPLRQTLRDGFRRAVLGRRRPPLEFEATLRQAHALETRLRDLEQGGGQRGPDAGDARPQEAARFVGQYLDLFSQDTGRTKRVLTMHRHRIRRQNPLLDAMLKVRLLTGPVRPPGARPGDDEVA